MPHALGSLAAMALAATMLVWSAPAHANGPFENHPDVRVFTPTPHVGGEDDGAAAAPPPAVHNVVVRVVVDTLAFDRADYGLLVDRFGKKRIRRPVRHGRGFRPRKSFASAGFRSDWSFGSSRGFRADWSFGTKRKFAGGKSLHGASRGLRSHKLLRGAGRGLRAGRSFHAGRGHGRH